MDNSSTDHADGMDNKSSIAYWMSVQVKTEADSGNSLTLYPHVLVTALPDPVPVCIIEHVENRFSHCLATSNSPV